MFISVKVGIPREVKNNEYQVAITPSGVLELRRHDHEVYQGGRGVTTHEDPTFTVHNSVYCVAQAHGLAPLTLDEVLR